MQDINPHPTCWADSGLSLLEQVVMRRVAEQYPDGAYAAFVRLMDQRTTATTDRTAERTAS